MPVTNVYLRGSAGNDTLLGGLGNDTLEGGAGADVLDGGDGFDIVTYANSGAGVEVNLNPALALYGDAQGDFLKSVEGLIGSSFGDVLAGDGAANTIDGGGGDDRIFGNAGNDTLSGGLGNDTLVGGAGADVLDGGAGFDVAEYSNSQVGVAIDLTTGVNRLGDAQGDVLSNIEGLIGSGFGDVLAGDGAANTIDGGFGDDRIFGNAGNDTLSGGHGNDTLDAGTGADVLVGGAGDDFLVGGNGDDLLDGGDGFDFAVYADSQSAVQVFLKTGKGLFGDAQGDVLQNVEGLIGSIYDDLLAGNAVANTIDGGLGNDYVYGYDGNDSLSGGMGNDTLVGGAGADVLDGEDGIDIVSYSSSLSNVVVDLRIGLGRFGDAQDDVLRNVEGLIGTTFDDVLLGSDVSNVINGGLGDDQLYGRLGNDVLDGGDGSDRIWGGEGNDVLTGGTGADQFNFDTVLNAATNVDVIKDFVAGTDYIGLDDAIFAATGGNGGLAASGFLASATGVATTAAQHILYNASNGDLLYDADGSGAGASIKFASIGAGLALTASDFFIF